MAQVIIRAALRILKGVIVWEVKGILECGMIEAFRSDNSLIALTIFGSVNTAWKPTFPSLLIVN